MAWKYSENRQVLLEIWIENEWNELLLFWEAIRNWRKNNYNDFVRKSNKSNKNPKQIHKSKAPQPADSWKPNILDATQYRDNCIGSNDLTTDPAPQSEDCLHLNIYVPGESSDKNEQFSSETEILISIHWNNNSHSTSQLKRKIIHPKNWR